MARLLRVLLVEDSAYDAELIETELRGAGYDLEHERVDAAGALRTALGQPRDIILCDYRLPGLEFREALELCRELAPDTPFILLSGTIGEEAAVDALRSGARNVVLKSNLSRLSLIVEQELADAEARRGRREAEEGLRESEERFRRLAENAPDIIYRYRLGPEPGFDFVSSAVTAITGYTPEEYYADAELAFKIAHPEDRALLDNVVRSGESATTVMRSIHKDGKVVWTEGRSVPVYGEEGRVNAVECIARDITASKETEEELRTANVFVSAVADSSPLAIVALDREARIARWSPAAERVYGWSGDDVLGQEPPNVPEAERAAATSLYERAFAGELIVDVEVTRLHKDGRLLDVSLSVAPLRGPDGDIHGLVAVGVDVSERKRAQRDLELSFELLRESDEARRSLLEKLVRAQEEERQRIAADIHDDSVQVMTALILRLELLGKKIADREVLAMVKEIEETARSSISRLRRLMFDLRPPALDREGLAPALRQYLEEMKSDRAIEYALEADMRFEPDPEMRVIAYRIAQEALANVAKHAQATSVGVTLRATEEGIRVRITDDGQGFSPDELGSAEPGHVGIAAMRERAEMAGGWLKIVSAPGAGATVEFQLPDGLGRR